jgi:hypothetical protein
MSGNSAAGPKPRIDRDAPTTDNDNDRHTPPEPTEEEVAAAEAVAGAREACFTLSRDGPAPRIEDVLRQMGRGPDGYEIPDGPDEFVPAPEAARRALDD